MNRINEIVLKTRRKGNTTFILKSAVNNPNCIIVCKTSEYAKELEKKYFKMLRKSSWWLRLKWRFFGRSHPYFFGLNFRFEAGNLPVIFDNSCLLSNNYQ